MGKMNSFGIKFENKILILLFTVVACIALALYVGIIKGEAIVYTHFFYIPVILAGLWYYRKAVTIALLLGMLHILITLFYTPPISINELTRVCVLVAVAYVIGLVSESRAESKEYAESIIKNFLDTLIVVDAEAKIKTVNPATCELLGYREEELIGQPISIIFAEEEEEEVHRLFQFFREPENAGAIRTMDTIRNRKLTYKTRDGRFIPMSFNASLLTDEAGDVAGVVAGAKDITEIKLAEAEIIRGKRFSENIVATIPDSLLVLDRDLRIKSANRSFYEKFQTEPEKVIGSGIAEILQDKDGRLSTELTKLFGTDDMLANFELPYYSERLGERIFNITARGIIVAEEEEEEEELVVLEDITELKRAEKEIMRKNEALLRLNKELDDYVDLISHDLKAPLRHIKAFSTFLNNDYGDKLDEKGRDYLRRIISGCDDMEGMIVGLLELARMRHKEEELEEEDLNELLIKIEEKMGPFLEEKNARIEFEDLPTLTCHRAWMRALFMNLITNGITYNDKDDKVVRIGFKDEEDRYLFYVADNGMGIEDRYKEEIFKPFKRYNAEKGGTGLGLSMCKKIVESYGGRIWVESEIGKGSTFYFTIPKGK